MGIRTAFSIFQGTFRICIYKPIKHYFQRYWIDENSYNCIHLTGYKQVDIGTDTAWAQNDTLSCLSNCGILDGQACPLYKIAPETVYNAENVTAKGLLEQAMLHQGIELPEYMLQSYDVAEYGKIFVPDVFLFSLFLAFGTLVISLLLKAWSIIMMNKINL